MSMLMPETDRCNLPIEPLKSFKTSGGLFRCDWNERLKGISEQLSMRPKVWGTGIWADQEMEVVAWELADSIGASLGLDGIPPLIPQDPVSVLEWLYDEGFWEEVDLIAEGIGSKPDWTLVNGKVSITFGDVVCAIRAGVGKVKRPKSKPAGWYGAFLEWIWPVLQPIALLAGLIAVAFGAKSCGK